MQEPSKFHLAYKHAYPQEASHFEFLSQAYMMQNMMRMEQKMGMQNENDWENPQYLAKRFGAFSKPVLDFLQSNPKPGTIWKNQQKLQYNTSIRAWFSNVRDMECAFHFGKHFFLIGCVDAQMLLNVQFKTYEKSGGAVTVHFLERCNYAVAKTMVLMKMCAMDGVPAKCIVQAWYSSTWSLETLKHFYAAIDALFKSKSEQVEQVVEILTLWRSAEPKSSKVAFEHWLKLQSPGAGSFSAAASLIDSKDQAEYCRYTLTGELKLDTEQPFANATMFTYALEAPPARNEPNVTEIVPMETEMQKEAGKKPIMSIVQNFILRGVDKLVELFKKKQLVFHFKVANVSFTNKPIIEYIKKHDPWVICWSNLLDYMPRIEFHLLAKACSTPDTLHAVHSSNWETQTFGTELSDYGVKARPLFLQTAIETSCMPFHHVMPRVRKYVSNPPFTHFRNIAGYFLAMKHRKDWMAYFFEGLVPLERVNDMSSGFYSVFLSQATNLHLNYSYNFAEWNIKGSPLHDEDDTELAQQMKQVQIKLQCASCKKFQGMQQAFKRCAQCKQAYYCDQECQKQHWPEHKKECKPVKK